MEFGTTVLSYLASVALRSLVLFGISALAIAMLRMKSAAARHAVWTAVIGGMLLMAVVEPLLPPLPVRILKPVDAAPAQLPDVPLAVVVPAAASPVGNPNGLPRLDWRDWAAVAYGLGALWFLARLCVSWLFTRRLLRAARPIDSPDIYESNWISVPMTAGRRILLPAGWNSWDPAKLEAVLAHERTHVRRSDWAIALLAGANRAIFWFHPLSWWLERRLATLAEEACDDAALQVVPGTSYAEALLDMAAAVKTAQGRLVWEAMGMAKAAEVKKRIERVLDETREIPREWTARRWAVLVACSLPVVWLAAVTQIAPAIAQEQPKTPQAMSEYLKGRTLGPGDVATMEQYLRTNPNDVDARSQLILYYYANNVKDQRLAHIYWLIANHPEASQAVFASRGLTAQDSTLNSAADFQRALGLWRQAAAAHPNDAAVLRNAADFLGGVGNYAEAENLLLQGKAMQPGNGSWNGGLGKLYATAILAATGDPKFPHPDAAFANRVKTALENSEDRGLVMGAGMILRSAARRPQPGESLPPNVLNLDDHPLLAPAVEFGNHLLERIGLRLVDQWGTPGYAVGGAPQAQRKGSRPQGVVGGVPGGVSGGTSGGVLGGIIGSVPADGPPPPPPPGADLPPAPPVVKKIEPVYPPLAMQARISGVVHLATTIGTDGSVRHIQVLSGHPLLVPAAMEALRQWTFGPQAAEGTYRVDIPFVLGNAMAAAEQAQGKALTIKIGGAVQASKLVNHVDPVYPPQARAAGIEGSVTLQVTIGEDGTVQNAEPVDGNPVLAAAAVDAVKQWTYQPTLLNGKPVNVITIVTISF